MAWNSSKPTNTEKIRDLGTVIRPNWVSLEQGEDANAMVNSNAGAFVQQYSLALIERDGRAANDDPATESETLFAYCKQDSGGVAEAHLKDPAGNILQLSSGGKIGSTAMEYEAESISFDGTNTYNENSVVTAWGSFAANGAALVTNNGLTCTVDGANVYTVSFVTPLSTLNYSVFVTLQTNPIRNFPQVSTPTVNDFEVRFLSTSSNNQRFPFYVMVVGGR